MSTSSDDPRNQGSGTDDATSRSEGENVTAATGAPCHQCNCKGFTDPDNDGLCDGFNNVGPTGNRCQHPIVSHF
jgi:hypothetical protein